MITLRLTITDSKLIMVYCKTTDNLVTTSSVALLVSVLQLAQIINYLKMKLFELFEFHIKRSHLFYVKIKKIIIISCYVLRFVKSFDIHQPS